MRGPAWTEQEVVRLRELWPTRWSAQRIADDLARPLWGVRHRARKEGLPAKDYKHKPYISVSIDQDVAILHLPSATGPVTALLDEADLAFVLGLPTLCVHWERDRAYLWTSGSRRVHRLLLNAPDDIMVDHRNGDGLDNRRSNLRIATQQQNAWNTRPRNNCRYKGVWLHEKSGLWTGTIRTASGHRKSIGYFRNEEDAARARDAMALEVHGEFARLNFPDQCLTRHGSGLGSPSKPEGAAV